MTKLNVVKVKPGLESIIKDFDSGNFYLDQFLKSKDSKNDSIGKSYILLSEDNRHVIGYYNISVGSMDLVENNIHKKIGGCVHINCFALDKRYQKKKIILNEMFSVYISDLLMQDCIKRILELRKEHLGFSFVTLNSTEEGKWMYMRNQFEPLEEDMFFSIEDSDIECTRMYLPLEIMNNKQGIVLPA